jgi:hypothetical protein
MKKRFWNLDTKGVHALNCRLDAFSVFSGHEMSVKRGLHQTTKQPIAKNLLTKFHQLKMPNNNEQNYLYGKK